MSHGGRNDEAALVGSLFWAARRPPSSPWRGAGTSCRSIRRSIRMRSRSGPSLRRRLRKRCVDGEVQAYVGPGLRFSGAPPAEVRAIESLGSFVIVRINPGSPRAADEAAACAAVKATVRVLAAQSGFIVHPYPVTPFHGDYLHHADLAAAAQARLSAGDARSRRPQDQGQRQPRADPSGLVGARRRLGRRGRRGRRRRARWRRQTLSVNGWLAPPWVRTGWFHAERLLADAVSDADAETAGGVRSARVSRPASSAASSSASTWSATSSPRSPARCQQDRRRLHRQARIRQRRVFGRDREHRLRFDRGPRIRRSSSAR